MMYISIILVCTFILLISNTETFSDHVCELLYDDKKRKPIVKQIKVFTQSECQYIISEAKKYANKRGWTTRRHNEYPTTDNEITKKWNIYPFIVKRIKTKIIPVIAEMFSIQCQHIGINEIFIAYYSMNGQRHLKKHKDGSEFSFVISLNSDFSGGGISFVNKSIATPKINTGEAVVFSGQEKHQGLPITSGKRYILTGFLHYVNENFCEDDNSDTDTE